MFKFIDANDNAFTSGAKVGAFKGAVKGLQNRAYHSLTSYWSSSDLKYMAKTSPQHFCNEYYKWNPKNEKYERKQREEPKSSFEKDLGSLVHCLVLTPDKFESDFFKMPELNLRTNDGKAEKERLLTENQGKIPVTDEMLVLANGMRTQVKAAIEKHPVLKTIYSRGIFEAAFFWHCPFSNLPMRAKLDYSCQDFFVELKTASKAGPEDFSKQLDNLHYDLSLIHYRTGAKQTFDIDLPAYFVVVESEPPHVVQVYRAGQGCWDSGHAKWMDTVQKLENGIKKNDWHGYYPDEFDAEINPPPWRLNKLMKEQDGI